MPYRKTAKKSKTKSRTKSTTKKTTKRRNAVKRVAKAAAGAAAGIGALAVMAKKYPKYTKLLKKVMAESKPYIEQLIPIVKEAIKLAGYSGAVGEGMAIFSTLADTEVGKKAVQLLIAKTKELTGIDLYQKPDAVMAEAYRQSDDFAHAEEEMINFERPTLAEIFDDDDFRTMRGVVADPMDIDTNRFGPKKRVRSRRRLERRARKARRMG